LLSDLSFVRGAIDSAAAGITVPAAALVERYAFIMDKAVAQVGHILLALTWLVLFDSLPHEVSS
jgi:hypothetical protein